RTITALFREFAGEDDYARLEAGLAPGAAGAEAAKRRANVGSALGVLGRGGKGWPVLAHAPDPTARGYAGERPGPAGGGPRRGGGGSRPGAAGRAAPARPARAGRERPRPGYPLRGRVGAAQVGPRGSAAGGRRPAGDRPGRGPADVVPDPQPAPHDGSRDAGR